MKGRPCIHCGQPHFSTQPCTAGAQAASEKVQIEQIDPGKTYVIGSIPGRVAVAPPRMLFDRNAYQRDYMRKARAEGKYRRKNPD